MSTQDEQEPKVEHANLRLVSDESRAAVNENVKECLSVLTDALNEFKSGKKKLDGVIIVTTSEDDGSVGVTYRMPKSKVKIVGVLEIAKMAIYQTFGR